MSKTVTITILRSDGRTFTAGDADWAIQREIKGLDSVEYDVYSQSYADGDGAIVTGFSRSPRHISFTMRGANPNMNEANRLLVNSFFIFRQYTYRLSISYQGVQRWIDAQLEDYACPAGNVYSALLVTPSFVCPDPMFKSMEEFGKDIASIEPRFGWPCYDVPERGTIYGVYNFAKTVLLDNDGDVSAYFRVYLEAIGSVTNPKIMTAQGYIRILDTMAAGDVYVVDCAACKVHKNGSNEIRKIDRKSNFSAMKVAVGGGAISFDADVGDNMLRVRPYYNKLYERM